MPPPTRREFFAAAPLASAACAVSAVALSAASYARAADKPNERVRLAVMGLRVRGKQLIPGFAAIRGDAKPAAPIEEGHKSTRPCHLGNIAFRTGKTLKFDAATETTDDAANHLLGREYRKGFELPAV